jgi:uncharacterized metal-binding protein (TIGR02443 family)
MAGATCPQCQGLDKVVMFRTSGVQYRECVSCGYLDQMHFDGGFRELETRVNRTEAEKLGDTMVVRLIDPDQAI